jgi:hypothetical protein
MNVAAIRRYSAATRAIEGKQRRKLAELPFDERKRQVAERIFRDMKGDIHHLTLSSLKNGLDSALPA